MAEHNKKQEYLESMKKIRAQLVRRYVDTSQLHVIVSGSSVHMTGALRKLRSHPNVDLRTEMDQISHILKMIPGIREVVWDVALRS